MGLLDGREMPIFGLGVFLASAANSEAYTAVRWALDAGYRLIDTAEAYGNEKEVGQAVRDSGVPRGEVFVTTKLHDAHHGYEKALEASRKSHADIDLEYVDLILVHSPNTGKLIETWDALLRLQKEGLYRSIGVSNYNVEHIEALRAHGRPMPVVNQIEMHPLVYSGRRELLEYCKQKKILVQAYGSMFWGQTDKLNDSTLAEVVGAHSGKTPAQILLRWGFQMGFQLIPKSVKQHRIVENMQIFDFELAPEEMTKLNSLDGLREDKNSALGYWSPLETPVDLGRVDLGALRSDL